MMILSVCTSTGWPPAMVPNCTDVIQTKTGLCFLAAVFMEFCRQCGRAQRKGCCPLHEVVQNVKKLENEIEHVYRKAYRDAWNRPYVKDACALPQYMLLEEASMQRAMKKRLFTVAHFEKNVSAVPEAIMGCQLIRGYRRLSQSKTQHASEWMIVVNLQATRQDFTNLALRGS